MCHTSATPSRTKQQGATAGQPTALKRAAEQTASLPGHSPSAERTPPLTKKKPRPQPEPEPRTPDRPAPRSQLTPANGARAAGTGKPAGATGNREGNRSGNRGRGGQTQGSQGGGGKTAALGVRAQPLPPPPQQQADPTAGARPRGHVPQCVPDTARTDWVRALVRAVGDVMDAPTNARGTVAIARLDGAMEALGAVGTCPGRQWCFQNTPKAHPRPL